MIKREARLSDAAIGRLADARAALADSARAANQAGLTSEVVADFVAGKLDAATTNTVRRRMLTDPLVLGQVADALRRPEPAPAARLDRRRLIVARVSLPAAAVSFADAPSEPFAVTLHADDLRISLVEEAGGRIAVYARSPRPTPSALTIRLAAGPELDPWLVELDLLPLGPAGWGARAELGLLDDVFARLGPCPTVEVLAAADRAG